MSYWLSMEFDSVKLLRENAGRALTALVEAMIPGQGVDGVLLRDRVIEGMTVLATEAHDYERLKAALGALGFQVKDEGDALLLEGWDLGGGLVNYALECFGRDIINALSDAFEAGGCIRITDENGGDDEYRFDGSGGEVASRSADKVAPSDQAEVTAAFAEVEATLPEGPRDVLRKALTRAGFLA